MQSWFERVCVWERALQGPIFHIKYIEKCVSAISCLCIHAMMKENSFYHSNYSLIFKKTEPIIVTHFTHALSPPISCILLLFEQLPSIHNFPVITSELKFRI